MRIDIRVRVPFVCGLTGFALLAACAAQTSRPSNPVVNPVDTVSTQAAKLEPANAAKSASIRQDYGKLPLSFEANQGQVDPQVKFTARGKGFSLFLTGSSAVLALTQGEAAKPAHAGRTTDVVRMELMGANPNAGVSGAEQLSGTANYFIGSDPSKWHSNIPAFASVRYVNVYNGIDLVYHGDQQKLEYDLVIAPNANPGPIRLHFSGARKLSLTPNGDLSIRSKNGQIAFRKPDVYQEGSGQHQTVPGRFVLLANHSVGFKLGSYDRSRLLVIDPVLVYSTFVSGSGGSTVSGVALDSAGNAYIAGSAGADYPVTAGAFQTTNNGGAIVAKLNPAGTALVYATYLGGSSGAGASSIAVDSSGDAFVAGGTNSTDFPVTAGAFQSTNKGQSNGFIAKLNPTGTALLFSTLLGGSGSDGISSLAIDSSGNSYVAGSTSSLDFPTSAGAFQTVNINPRSTGFVTKVNPAGTALIYSTYLGGSGGASMGEFGPADAPNAITVDDAGDAYVGGTTSSTDFPVTPGAFLSAYPGPGNSYATGFVTEFNPSGNSLIFSTFLGGAGQGTGGDWVAGIKVSAAGNAYVTGGEYTPDFPTTPGAFQTSQNTGGNPNNYPGQSDSAFVTEFNKGGTALVYSTLIGGLGGYQGNGDSAAAIALDSAGNAFVVGTAYSNDFPTTANAYQSGNNNNGCPNAFLTVVDPTGSALAYSTYFGGSGGDDYCGGDWGNALALDANDNAYFAGFSMSPDFPVTTGAFETTHPSGGDAFVAKMQIGFITVPILTKTTMTFPTSPLPVGVPFTFVATVTAEGSNQIPSGGVDFTWANGAVDVPLDSAGVATYTTSFNVPSSWGVQATYTGDSKFAASGASVGVTSYLPTPVFKPAGGKYLGSVTVSLSDLSPIAAIYYTIDGSNPTINSPAFSEPFKISSGYVIVKTIAAVHGAAPTSVVKAAYSILLQTPTPKISPVSGRYPAGTTITITDPDVTATIRYTTDGSTPTKNSNWYHEPLVLTGYEIVKAIAFSTGRGTSAVASAIYTIQH